MKERHLYAIQFTGDLVKVGVTKNINRRIDQHATRVAAAGLHVEIAKAWLCFGDPISAERELIRRCSAAAKARHCSEWFRGLVFDEVCQWAEACATQPTSTAGQETHWQRILSSLRAAGWTQIRLAQHCGVSQSSISELACGHVKDPYYSLGASLEALADDFADAVETAARARFTQA